MCGFSLLCEAEDFNTLEEIVLRLVLGWARRLVRAYP